MILGSFTRAAGFSLYFVVLSYMLWSDDSLLDLSESPSSLFNSTKAWLIRLPTLVSRTILVCVCEVLYTYAWLFMIGVRTFWITSGLRAAKSPFVL